MTSLEREILADGRCRVSGRTFDWSVFISREYRLILQPYGDGNRDEMLRITEESGGYDVVLALTHCKRDAVIRFSPIFVLGIAFPVALSAVPAGTRIRLRPRICWAHGPAVTPVAVERIVSWTLSRHFRPVRCDRHGSLREPEAE